MRLAFDWWLRELLACLPPTLRRRLTGAAGTTVIALAMDGSAWLLAADGAPAAPVDRASLAGLRHRTVARLPAEVALRTMVALPLAAERNLATAVEFELPRRSPYPPEAVYHAFRVAGRDRAAGQIRIELTIAARDAVDGMLAHLAALGVKPGRVEIAGDRQHPAPSPDLLGRGGRPAARRNPATALAGLAAVLALAVIVVPLVAMQQRIDALTDKVAAQKHEADQAVALRAEIRSRTQAAGFLDSRRQAAPSPTRMLDALSRLLPDDTWLSALDLKGNEITLTGSSASASSVIALLDRSGVFRKPSFRSPVTQAPRSNQEEFNIAAEIAPEAAP